MLYGKRILAVVPARGGSKGIPLKNLIPVGGVSMVARVGHLCRELGWLDRAVVSTDHEEIKSVALASGLDAPFMRPDDIAQDRVGDWDVLYHALFACEEIDAVTYDVVVMLQPTSPLRTPEDVRRTVDMLVSGEWDSVWTVSETDSKGHPLKQLTRDEDGTMAYYDSAGANIIARQQLTPVYHRNGVAYAMTRDCIVRQQTIKGERCGAIVIDGYHASIDTEFDIELVEFLMSRSNPRR